MNLSLRTCQPITDHLAFKKNKISIFNVHSMRPAATSLLAPFQHTFLSWYYQLHSRQNKLEIRCLSTNLANGSDFKISGHLLCNLLGGNHFLRLSFLSTNQQSIVKLVFAFILLKASVCFKLSRLYNIIASWNHHTASPISFQELCVFYMSL